MLVEAIGRNAEHADRVHLMVSATDDELCSRCGDCLKACPIHARHLEEEVVDAGETETAAAPAPPASTDLAPAAAPATPPVAPASTEASATVSAAAPPASTEAPTAAAPAATSASPPSHIVVEHLYCLGCSACMQACPNGACYYQEITTSEFLRD
jgi:ferredoxin